MDAWKLWIIFGLVLAIAELLVLPAQFLLVALGICALLVGVLAWGTDIGTQAQMAWFAVLAVVLVPLFVVIWRRKSTVRYAGTAGETPHAPQTATVVSLDPFAVKLNGDRFPAETDQEAPFFLGQRVQVHRFAGITAFVRHPVE